MTTIIKIDYDDFCEELNELNIWYEDKIKIKKILLESRIGSK